MNKKVLRNLYKSKRAAIDPREKLKLDDLMLIRFQQLYFEEVRVLMTYWPMPHVAEPNMHLFTGYLRHAIPSVQVAYPVIDPQTETMQAFLIDEDTTYTTNAWGITEPKNGHPIYPDEIDLVFVPLLIFDKSGQRVGFGKGYYDKFLAVCREDVITIGFSYFDPVENITDADAFDVPLNYCITPNTVYEF